MCRQYRDEGLAEQRLPDTALSIVRAFSIVTKDGLIRRKNGTGKKG